MSCWKLLRLDGDCGMKGRETEMSLPTEPTDLTQSQDAESRSTENGWKALYEMAAASRRDFRAAFMQERKKNRVLRQALEDVRLLAIPAGAAFVRGNADRVERVTRVLDIIDDALAPEDRKTLAEADICPECGGELDTGWECTRCGYDAITEATGTTPEGLAITDIGRPTTGNS